MIPAVWLGRFIGAVLAECAPVIVEIIRESSKNTVEDGAYRDDLRKRLHTAIRLHKDGTDTTRRTGAPPPADKGANLGG